LIEQKHHPRRSLTALRLARSFYREGEPAGFIMSLVGAILLVIAYHAFARRRSAF
jgi:hypothetical protein